jgi:N-acyl homoserine lactone hydrolase
MRIHAIQTGTVAVKTRQREGVGTGKRRFLNMLLDREWTAPLPIYAWAIEHPDGAIVVDTGETSRAPEPGYFPRWHPYFRSGLREWVQPEEEVGPQLERIGILPADVRAVVMTHLHTDHAGGLHYFPKSEIFVSRTEWHHAIGVMGRLRGYLNNRFPNWLRPRLVDLTPEPFDVFPESFTLTTAGDVRLVPTPGHTPGQMSVVIEDDGDTRVFLAGDASYSEELMLRGAIDGVSPDDETAKTTLERIRRLTEHRPTVYLPSHDPESGVRLDERRTAGSVVEKRGAVAA